MTDESNLLDNGVSAADEKAAEPVVSLTQSQLSDKIRFAKKDGYEKAVRERERYESESNSKSASSNNSNGAPALTKEDIVKITQETREHERNLERASHVAQTFLNRVEADKINVPDYDKEVTIDFYEKNPRLVELAANIDNTATVMLELKRNPAMRATINSALREGDHEGALHIMGELSSRLKKNKDHEKVSRPSDPGFKASPSRVGTENGSPKSTTDWRLHYAKKR